MLFVLALALGLAAAPPDMGDCRACHVDVARAHDASRHGTAATNPSFVASLNTSTSPRDRAWCIACHAPRAGNDTRAHGVGCSACHDGAHTAKVSEAACARCHEVGLPPSHARAGRDDVRAQDTPREHALWSASLSPAAASTARRCVGCHLEGHRWPGGHDAAFAARALSVDATRVGADIVVTLAVDGIGHPMPTGDPFRVLAVRACADEACAIELASARVGRALVPGTDQALRVVDTRPRPGRAARVRLPNAADAAFIEVALESVELTVPAEPRLRLRTLRLAQ